MSLGIDHDVRAKDHVLLQADVWLSGRGARETVSVLLVMGSLILGDCISYCFCLAL